MKYNFKQIYVQRSIYDDFLWRANAEKIIARFPAAEVKEVESHWRIPELFEADAKDWMKMKREVLVLGIKSGLSHQKNGRSADFIAASSSNGCLSSCQYCYVARRKGGSNPLTIFVNIEEIAASIRKHQKKLGAKLEPNQCDASFWTYDIGCNADLSADSFVCDNPGFLVREFTTMEHAKGTFATKTVADDYWLALDPQGKTRIRYSLMPQKRRASLTSARRRFPNALLQRINWSKRATKFISASRRLSFTKTGKRIGKSCGAKLTTR